MVDGRETKSFGEILIVILYKNIPNFQGILSVRHFYKIIREVSGGNKNSYNDGWLPRLLNFSIL